jgi:putative membrane protein
MISTRIDRRILFCIALTLLASLAVHGQNSNGLPRLGSTDPNATGAHSFADQAFVKSLMERDAGEEQLGQLAQQKSQSDDVKNLGQKTAEARTSLDGQLKTIAKSLEVGAPKGPSKKDKQLVASLQALSGAQFDEEYIKAIDKAHKEDIKNIDIEIQNTQDSSVRQAAQQIEGILTQYLQVIEQVAKAHSVALDAK